MKNLILCISACLLCFQGVCLARGGIDKSNEGTAEQNTENDYGVSIKQNKNRADRNQWEKILGWPNEFGKKTQGYGLDFSGIDFYDIAAGRYIVHVYGPLGADQGEHLSFEIQETSKGIRIPPWYLNNSLKSKKRRIKAILIQTGKRGKCRFPLFYRFPCLRDNLF